MLPLFLATPLIVTSVLLENPDNIRTLASVGNQASLERIDSYYAEIKLTSSSPMPVVKTARYWRDRTDVRISESSSDGYKTDAYYSGDRVQMLRTGLGDPPPILKSVGLRNRRTAEADPWDISLFSLPFSPYDDPPYPNYSLHDVIRKSKCSLAEWTCIDNVYQAHLIFKAPVPFGTYEVWVDPARNWLIRRCIHTFIYITGMQETEYVVDEFQEIKPGLHVPARISRTRRSHRDGSVLGSSVALLSGILVNHVMPTIPELPKPSANTFLVDHIEGKQYLIDEKERQIGAKQPITTFVFPQQSQPWAKPPKPLSLTPDLFTIIRSIPKMGWEGFAFVASVGVLGTVLFLRRRQQANSTGQ